MRGWPAGYAERWCESRCSARVSRAPPEAPRGWVDHCRRNARASHRNRIRWAGHKRAAMHRNRSDAARQSAAIRCCDPPHYPQPATADSRAARRPRREQRCEPPPPRNAAGPVALRHAPVAAPLLALCAIAEAARLPAELLHGALLLGEWNPLHCRRRAAAKEMHVFRTARHIRPPRGSSTADWRWSAPPATGRAPARIMNLRPVVREMPPNRPCRKSVADTDETPFATRALR